MGGVCVPRARSSGAKCMVAYKIFYRRWSWPFVAQHRAHFVSRWCYVTLRFPWQRVPWSTHYTKERLCSGVLNMALLWITKERPEGSPVCHAWWEVEPWSPLAHHHLIHKHNRDKRPLLPNLPGVQSAGANLDRPLLLQKDSARHLQLGS